MFGIDRKEVKRILALFLTAVLVLTSTPISSFAVDVASMLNAVARGSGKNVSGGDVSGGDVSGGDVSGGDVSGGDVSGGDVSGGDFTVTVSGKGKVDINQTGSMVTVSEGESKTVKAEYGEVTALITPYSSMTDGVRSYIQSAVDKERNSILAQGADKYQPYPHTVQITKDNPEQALTVSFGKEYLFKVNSNAGGTVSLTNGEINYNYEESNPSLWVDENAPKLALSVNAETGYRIKSVKVGGSEKIAAGLEKTYELQDISIAATEIEVTFVPIYTITVSYDRNGNVTIDGTEIASGSVHLGEWSESGTALFAAQPNTNYRVANVKIDGTEQSWADKGKNDASFTTMLERKGNHVIEVTFALNEYKVNVTSNGNVKIFLNGTETGNQGYIFEHGADLEWKMVPAEGYSVTGVTVNGKNVMGSVTQNRDGISYSIIGVNADVTLAVATTAYTKVTDDIVLQSGVSELHSTYYSLKFADEEGNDVKVLHNGVDGDTPFVVVPTGTKFTFSPKTASGVNYTYLSVNGSSFENSKVFEGNAEIQNIKVSDMEYLELAQVANLISNYKIVMDGSAPAVNISKTSANANGLYNSDVKVTVTVQEEALGSGIAKVEYWVTAANEAGGTENTQGSKENPEKVYEYQSGASSLSGTYDFKVLASLNDSSSVKVYVKVTDLAGNVYTNENSPMVLAINNTNPDVKVEIDGTLSPDGLAGNYGTGRTATITITDRADSFDETAATEGVKVTGGTVTVSKWNTTGNVHKATVSFEEDGVYTWSYSYKNKADRSNNTIDEQGESLWQFIIDKQGAEIKLSTERDAIAGASKLFNKDVAVSVKVKEGKNSAGILKVSYEVNNGEEITQSETLYLSNSAEQGKEEWEGVFTVDSKDARNNRNGITVTVTVLDKAGNTSSADYVLDMDTTAPIITVTYDDTEPAYVDGNGYEYFDTTRTAVIEIQERTSSFNKDEVKIIVSGKNAAGESVAAPYVSGWSTVEGKNPDDAIHRATITFATDANYEWSVEYTDEAGNTAENNGDCKYAFTKDEGRPDGEVLANERSWSLAPKNEFEVGAIFGGDVTVSYTAKDVISPIYSVEYYMAEGAAAEKMLTVADLESIPKEQWKIFPADGMTVRASKQFVIYMRVTDCAMNYSYISSAGVVADNAAPTISGMTPGISNSFNGMGLANGNVSVSFSVTDPVLGETATGLSRITYQVTSNGVVTQNGEISASGSSYTGSITVDAGLNNSNDVKVQITATDMAGNSSSAISSTFMIDTTAPTISVSYDNNAADSEKYYLEERVATITITERNFRPEDALVTITNTDGVIPVISGWTSIGSGDSAIHTATISYTADGDYTFEMEFTDAAGNVAETVSYAEGTTNPAEFTIDRTKPAVNVRYDNNDAQNGKYFKEQRTATITIVEHNFDEERVVVTQTAALDGEAITIPAIQWTHNEDNHVGHIFYQTDGDYTFAISMKDMAGNENFDVDYGNSVAAQDFTVDTKIAVPVVKGVENGKSYKDSVVPEISFEDVNFENSEIKLLRTRNGEINKDVTDQFITAMEMNKRGGQGRNDTFAKIADNDGIYTLMVKVTDKAGNEENKTIMFTVNRFGSVYAFGEYLVSLKDAYVQKVEQPIVITEYNPDELVKDSVKVEITKDGTPLDNVVFTINEVVDAKAAGGEEGWYQYEYVIDPSNFAADGIYKIVVSSEDAAGNKPETANFEECTVLFRVDTVGAEITSIRGLENNIVNAENQKVEFDVFDAIGLRKVTVYVNDAVAAVYEEFDSIINYTGSVTLTAGTNQKVRIVVEDMAGNVTDTAAEAFAPAFAFNDTITVSTSFWIRFFANKPLVFGSVAAVAAVVGGTTGAVIFRRRKKSLRK